MRATICGRMCTDKQSAASREDQLALYICGLILRLLQRKGRADERTRMEGAKEQG